VELHPVLKAMLETGAGAPDPRTIPVETARRNFILNNRSMRRPPVAEVEDRRIAGPRGDVALRIYRSSTSETRPVVMYFHGGGFVLGSIETHDGLARELCIRAAATVVSVDYGLAPEHKFPAAPDDCLAATHWAAAHAAEFGGDPSRMALAGDSAGGNLAAVTAIRLRDEGKLPIAALLLMYPVTDHYDAGSPSYSECSSGPGLTADTMRWFWDHYLSDPSEADHPFASPNRLGDLRGLPATYVFTAAHDPLRDEGETFARRLAEAGVACTCLRYPDMNHGFVKWVDRIDRADAALDAACAWIRRMLDPHVE